MTVQCPKCGHSGSLPSNAKMRPHKIRCPKCGVKFDTKAPEADPNQLSDIPTELGIEIETAYLGEEEAIEVPSDIGKNLDVAVSDEDEPAVKVDPPTARRDPIYLSPDPWFYGFLEIWGVLYLVAAGFAAAAAFLLCIGSVAGSAEPVSQTLLGLVIVVGPLFIAAFVLVTAAAVIFLIVDLARNVRLTRFHTERTESILRTESGNRR